MANFGVNAGSVLLGNGNGAFRLKTDIALSTTPLSLAVSDFNGDGKLDAMVTSDYIASVIMNDGHETFAIPHNCLFGAATNAVVMGDFNGDGPIDLGVADRAIGDPGIMPDHVLE